MQVREDGVDLFGFYTSEELDHDVNPKTAAMIMAIVADKMGKPLNELRFISIKEVK